jgi:incFII family plasmid replication initiator RepA
VTEQAVHIPADRGTFSGYRQVKNPNPVFTPLVGKKTLPFCQKLMDKAVGFSSRFIFMMHVALARSAGKRRRGPPLLRRRAIDALMQAMCHHYDPLANRVQCSVTTMAIACGLATESAGGRLSITRATRALRSLSDLGLITYDTEYDATVGCYIPSDITFTPALFDALEISDVAVAAARRSRSEWDNLQREKQNLPRLDVGEQIAKAFRFVRERFRSYQQERKAHGLKRARARKDESRTRKDIETLVKRQLTREIAQGTFTGTKEAVFNEVKRRVKERMILSRDKHYTRLATASP